MPPKFQYFDPEMLIRPLPGEVRHKTYDSAIQKAAEITGPVEGMPIPKTFDEALGLAGQMRSYKGLMRDIPEHEVLRGRTNEELMAEIGRQDDRSFLGKTLDYISKPFRWETSVVTAPLVAALEAARTAPPQESLGDYIGRTSDLATLLTSQAVKGERELSMYDQLKRMGMADLGALPLGILLDVVMSPSTYLGVGGLTKLGKIARTSTRAKTAGRIIDEASEVGGKIARATERLGPEALEFPSTMAEQASKGHRALVHFGGRPVVKGAPVFEGIEKGTELLKRAPVIGKIIPQLRAGIKPAGIDQATWDTLRDLERRRRGSIGLQSKDFLEDLTIVAREGGLTPEQLDEVYYALAGPGAPSERIPWGKIAFQEIDEPTAMGVLRAKGVTPESMTVPSDEFSRLWKEEVGGRLSKSKEHFVTSEGKLVIKDVGTTSPLRQKDFILDVEARNIFEALPDKWKTSLAKVYDVETLGPKVLDQFVEDWWKFSTGNDFDLSPKFAKWADHLTTKKGGHKAFEGVTEIVDTGGRVHRVLGDIKMVDTAQEAVRVYAKELFEDLLEKETSLGILTDKVDNYVTQIYKTPVRAFKKGKILSTTPYFTKERKFRTATQAIEAGYEPVTNILELAGIRGQRSIEARESMKMLTEAGRMFGVDPSDLSMKDWGKLAKAMGDPDDIKAVRSYLTREGYRPMQLGEREIFFQPEIHDVLNKVVEPFTTEETFRQFMTLYDKSLNVWKGYVTAVNPKFHMRNFVSNNYLLFLKDGLNGLNPVRHTMARNIMRGDKGVLLLKTGEKVSYDDIRKMTSELGLMGSGFMGGELKSAFHSHLQDIIDPSRRARKMLNPASSRNAVITAGRWLGTKVENEAKMVGFINDLIEHGDPALATQRTFEFLYDYMDLTNFEKIFAKRLIPFWTWMSKNIPQMFKTVVMQPAKVGVPAGKIPMIFEHKMLQDLRERGVPFPQETVPPWITGQGAFPMSPVPWGPTVDEEGKVPYYSPGLPYMDLARLEGKELLSALTPLAKFFEFVPKGGYSMFMDRPYEQYPGQLQEAPIGAEYLPKSIKDMLGVREGEYGTYLPGETAALINTLLPMLRTPTKLLKAPPGTGKYVYPSELLGQKFFPIDPFAERRSTMYDVIERLGAQEKVEKGLSRREGAAAIKEGDIPLDKLMEIYMLRYGPRR